MRRDYATYEPEPKRRRTDAPRDLTEFKGVALGVLLGAAAVLAAIVAGLWLAK